MKNLKKILLFTLFTIFIQSCNNDDDVKNEEPTQKAVEEKVLDFKINNPQTSERLMNNIQVGEVLEFELSIPDGVYDPKASYKLSPLSVEAEANKKHQRIGVDYVFNKPEYFKTSPSGARCEPG